MLFRSYIQFWMDSAKTERIGEEKYHGKNISDKNFPTRTNPLFVNGNRFFMHFHSDGSTEEWGYRFLVVPVEATKEDEVESDWGDGDTSIPEEKQRDLDVFPFYENKR